MPTDGRPGGTGFTTVTTAPDTAVVPFVNPDAPTGQKDQDITIANLKAVLGAVAPGPITAVLTGDGTTTDFDVVHNSGTNKNTIQLFTDAGVEMVEGQHFVAFPKTGAETTTSVVRIDRYGDSTGDQPLPDGAQVAVFVSPAGALTSGAGLGGTVDITQVAVGDAVFTPGDEATQLWTGTDDTAAIQAAIDAAPAWSILDFGGKDYMCGPISFNKPLTPKNGRIIAPLGSTGYHLTLTDSGATEGAWGNHLTGTNLDHFRLDGNARRNDMGGIDCVRLQHFEWNHVEVYSYQREGIRWHDSMRECQLNFVHVRYCGGVDYPAVDLQNRSTRDGHNNVEINHLKAIYNAGVAVRLGSDHQGNATRAVHFYAPMWHGAEDDSPATFNGPDGVAYASAQFANKTQFQLVNGRQATIFGGRIHASGTAPLIEILDNLAGDTVPTAPLSSLNMYGLSLEAENAVDKILIDGTMSDFGLFGNTMANATHLEGVVTNNSGSNNEDLIKSFGNSWDHEQRFERWANVTSWGGTAYTIDRDDARLLRRCIATSAMAITIPADVSTEDNIPVGEAFGFQVVEAQTLSLVAASGVTIEGATSVAGPNEFLEIVKTGADRWFCRSSSSPVLLASSFNPVADGVADDTAALQTAINAVTVGGTLDGEGKTYQVGNLWLKSQMELRNFRFITKATNTTDVCPVNIGNHLATADGDHDSAEGTAARLASQNSPGIHDVIVRNVHVDGNRTNQTNVDFIAEGAFRDGGKHGFALMGFTTNITLIDCSAEFCATDGLLVYRGLHALSVNESVQAHTNLRVENCRFNWNRRHGGAGDAINGARFINCEMNDNGQDINGGATIGDQGATVPAGQYGNGWDMEGYGVGSRVRNIRFINCDMLRNVRDGLMFYDTIDQDDPTFLPRDDIKIIGCSLDYGTDNVVGDFGLTITCAIGNKAKAPAYTNVVVSETVIEGRYLLRSLDRATFSAGIQTIPGTSTTRALMEYATNVRFVGNVSNITNVTAANSSYTTDEVLVASQAWDPGEIAGSTTATVSIPVPGAVYGDIVTAGHEGLNTAINAGLILDAFVVFPGESVQATIFNARTVPRTVSSGDLHVRVEKAGTR